MHGHTYLSKVDVVYICSELSVRQLRMVALMPRVYVRRLIAERSEAIISDSCVLMLS